MTGQQAFFVEVVLVFGGVLGWAVWELFNVRRSQRRDREASAQRARHAEGQHGPDQG